MTTYQLLSERQPPEPGASQVREYPDGMCSIVNTVPLVDSFSTK